MLCMFGPLLLLQPSTRQLLLMCLCPADRLRLLLELLQRLDRLCCSACGAQLATTAEVLAMTTEGIGGTYVNSHG
jgi:cereblon